MFEWLTVERAVIGITTPIAFCLLAIVFRFFSKPLTELGEIVLKELNRPLDDWLVDFAKQEIWTDNIHLITSYNGSFYKVFLLNESVEKLLTIRDGFFLQQQVMELWRNKKRQKSQSKMDQEKTNARNVLNRYKEVKNGDSTKSV